MIRVSAPAGADRRAIPLIDCQSERRNHLKPHFVYRLRDAKTRERLLIGADANGRTLAVVRLPAEDSRWGGEASPSEYEIYEKETRKVRP